MPIPDLPPSPPPVPVMINLSTEQVAVGDGQHMGLVGLGYEREFNRDWRGGMAVYGASTGTRGGFFAWGVTAARQAQWGDWHAEAGLFLGGGGGSPPWVGSGLMLRPHLELGHRLVGPVQAGLGWSQVVFPDGQVRSSQPYLALRWRAGSHIGSALAAQGDPEAAAPTGSQKVEGEFAAVGGAYHLARSPRRDGTGPHPDLRFGGLSYRQGLPLKPLAGGQPYAVVTALGAIGGGYDGFAELTGGLGLAWPLGQDLALRTEAAWGSAGAGGTVDSGGGLVGKVGAALVWQPSSTWSLGLQGGLLRSRGPFDAREMRLSLAWRGWDWLPTAASAAPTVPSDTTRPAAHWTPWAVAAGVQHFSHMRRDSGAAPAVQVLGLQLERSLDPAWRLLARAGTGVGGQAGGYATGQLGLGWLAAPWGQAGWRLGAEASLGAAGGGGVQVSGGLFGQAQVQARLPVAPDWALQVDLGQLKAARGALSSPFVGIGLVSEFSRLQAR